MPRDPAALQERVAASELAEWASRAEGVERQTETGYTRILEQRIKASPPNRRLGLNAQKAKNDLLETHEKGHNQTDSLQNSHKRRFHLQMNIQNVVKSQKLLIESFSDQVKRGNLWRVVLEQ